MLEAPILFLVFNRPEVTRRVFERIREVQPKQLFVAADGPRPDRPEEIEKCQLVREIVTNVDWDCEVKTLFREENLGCGRGPYTAINWFFEQVDQGVILEDDVLPDMSFFTFCQQLLDQYREDQRVMMISGFNVCGRWKENLQDYHFSFFGGGWGWASWKRAWKHYDYYLEAWADPNVKKIILDYFPPEIREKRRTMYDTLFNGREGSVWDLQWTFAKLLNSGLSIVPSKSLVQNIGFGEGATHTLNKDHVWAYIRAQNIDFPLRSPNSVIVDDEYDKLHLNPKLAGRARTLAFTRVLQRFLHL